MITIELDNIEKKLLDIVIECWLKEEQENGLKIFSKESIIVKDSIPVGFDWCKITGNSFDEVVEGLSLYEDLIKDILKDDYMYLEDHGLVKKDFLITGNDGLDELEKLIKMNDSPQDLYYILTTMDEVVKELYNERLEDLKQIYVVEKFNLLMSRCVINK